MVVNLKSNDRVVIEHNLRGSVGLDIILDTGAWISIAPMPIGLFKAFFSDAYNSGKIAKIGGFGSNVAKDCDIYIVPRFKLEELVIKDLPFAVTPHKTMASTLVLASNLFWNNDITVRRRLNEVYFDDTNPLIKCELKSHGEYSRYANGVRVTSGTASELRIEELMGV